MLSQRFIFQTTIVSFFLSLAQMAFGQLPTPQEVIEKSIDFHDPDRIWGKENLTIALREKRPDGANRTSKLKFNWSQSAFELHRDIDGNQISYQISQQDTLIYFNGQAVTDSALIRKYRLEKKHALLLRDYYNYLYGLPMLLKEDIAFAHEVRDTVFDSRHVYSVSLHYEPPVGNDIWYFYFDKNDYSLMGYRFYHDPSANDGEYIVVEGMAELEQFKLPKIRKWYLNKNAKFLGEDTITELK